MVRRLGLVIGRLLLVPAMAALLVASPAAADKRVALVIGNSSYQHVPELVNPINAATSVAALLNTAGFNVVDVRRNVGIADLRRTLSSFSDLARDADIALVFYAGHGIEVDGVNYLIPVDAKLERDFDVE